MDAMTHEESDRSAFGTAVLIATAQNRLIATPCFFSA